MVTVAAWPAVTRLTSRVTDNVLAGNAVRCPCVTWPVPTRFTVVLVSLVQVMAWSRLDGPGLLVVEMVTRSRPSPFGTAFVTTRGRGLQTGTGPAVGVGVGVTVTVGVAVAMVTFATQAS